MKKVIIESPLKEDDVTMVPYYKPLEWIFQRNIRYARWCCYDSIMQGEAPFASHLFCTQFLDDTDKHQRRLGMNAGQAWYKDADYTVAYLDLGETEGMKDGMLLVNTIVRRKLPKDMMEKFEAGEDPPHTFGIY